MMFTRYRAIFRDRPFRLFWLGFTFSVLGDAMTRVALTWLVYEATRSAEALGWLMLCYTGPIVVGGLLAGWLLDRFDRRTVMLVDSLLRGAAVALVPLLSALGALELWHVYLVAALYGLLMMVSLAGGPALVPSLVRREDLPAANALEVLSFTLGGVIGPFLAGLLIAVVGAPNVAIVDAISYVAFALALARIRGLGAASEARRSAPPPYRLRHAVALVVKHPALLATTLMFMTFSIGAGLLAVWLPILSDQTLGGGPELYGALLGVMALGELIGALLVGGATLVLPLGTLICIAQALAGAALVLLVAAGNASVGRGGVWLAGVGLALFGAFDAPLTVWAQTLRMRVIPEALRGRTFALLRMLIQAGNPIGGALGGILLPILGVAAAIGVSALLVGLPGLAGFGVKALRRAGASDERVDARLQEA